ncbi:MAG: metallophosphoesterase, partial [Patescibacteria group bacterium]
AVIFSAAIIFSAYGFWNAQHPQVKNITIKIKNLPAAWQGKTIVQLADIHLGRVHGEKFLQNIVDQTNAQNPDLILITGDLFDGMDGGLDVFIEPLNNLRAKEGVFFVTGNHESYVGLDRALTALRQTTIKILINEIVVVDGLQIVGLDYSLLSGEIGITGRSSDEEKIINSLPGWDRDKPSILMYHAPINIGQAVATGINFQLSGHSHNGQIWPFNFFTWLIYGQYDYGLNSLGDFTIYTTNGLGTWGPPMRTGNTPEIPVFKLK